MFSPVCHLSDKRLKIFLFAFSNARNVIKDTISEIIIAVYLYSMTEQIIIIIVIIIIMSVCISGVFGRDFNLHVLTSFL